MAVGNVEIVVGQVWRTREGAEATVESIDDHPDFPINLRFADCGGNCGGNCGKNGKKWGDLGEPDDDPRDLIELVRDEHGFTIWRGGAQPPDTVGKLVNYRSDNSAIVYGPFTAEQCIWTHSIAGNITAYKVVELARQPAPSTPDSASLAEETLSALGWVFDGNTWVEQPKASLPEWGGVESIEMHEPAISAPALLTAAAKHMNDRAATYDKPEGERSMAQTVAIFKAFHGIDLTEAQGWHFMQVLKDVRLFTREAYHADSAEDCIAYAALKAEAMVQEGGA